MLAHRWSMIVILMLMTLHPAHGAPDGTAAIAAQFPNAISFLLGRSTTRQRPEFDTPLKLVDRLLTTILCRVTMASFSPEVFLCGLNAWGLKRRLAGVVVCDGGPVSHATVAAAQREFTREGRRRSRPGGGTLQRV